MKKFSLLRCVLWIVSIPAVIAVAIATLYGSYLMFHMFGFTRIFGGEVALSSGAVVVQGIILVSFAFTVFLQIMEIVYGPDKGPVSWIKERFSYTYEIPRELEPAPSDWRT